jgi:aminoglycoside phosphotransferase (APT) family kinase protein
LTAAPLLRRDEVVPYLIARDLLPAATVVDQGARVVDASRRNSNHRVELADGSGLLIKQAPHAESRRSLTREATVLSALWASAARRRITNHLAPLLHWDQAGAVLVLGDVRRDAPTLHAVAAGGGFSASLARALGHLLARVSRVPLTPPLRLPAYPFALTVHRPDVALVTDASPATLQLIRLVQADRAVHRALDDIQRDWRADSFIHGDAKWDNVVVLPRPSGGRVRLRLVDWELAGLGDRRWDVATALATFVQQWVIGMPVSGSDPTADLARAPFPLGPVRPAMQALLEGWLDGLGPDVSDRGDELAGVARLCGARLVVTAFEYVQMATAVWASLIRLLQVAKHLLLTTMPALTAVLGRPVTSLAR